MANSTDLVAPKDAERLEQARNVVDSIEERHGELLDKSVILSVLVTDAIFDGDRATLDVLAAGIEKASGWAVSSPDRFLAGHLRGLGEVVEQALMSLPPEEARSIAAGSVAHRFLAAIEGVAGSSNRALAERGVATDEATISRVGATLACGGLAQKRRVGHTNEWLITPRGHAVLRDLDRVGRA